MKINYQPPTTTTNKADGESTRMSKSGTQAHQTSGSRSVETSDFTMNKIQKRIQLEPDIRADKVAELKAKIESGEYQVNSEQLASKMILDSLREEV